MDTGEIVSIYNETVEEAGQRGISGDTAHQEGVTAAAMLLASMDGLEDAEAREKVETAVARA